MRELMLTILFFSAFSGTVYFFGTLMVWMVQSISQSINKNYPVMSKGKINVACWIMIGSILLWTIIFYNLI